MNSHDAIARKFENYFQNARMTSSYKPVMLLSILYHIKQRKSTYLPSANIYFISLNDIALFFLKFYFYTLKYYDLNHLTNKNNKIGIYRIIEKYFRDFNTFPEYLNHKIITKTINQLFRNVIFLLLNDIYLYDFYDEQFQEFRLPHEFIGKDDFRVVIKNKKIRVEEIKYLGIKESAYLYLSLNYTNLKKKINLNLIQFLKKVNYSFDSFDEIDRFYDNLSNLKNMMSDSN
ncbi:MAG: hypothetical protein JW776_16840 [Candidatus Lokiarchaeota archaeon]|nr:hypothetical protein [Candidatus Lokiarchaeota archaeon]